MCQKMVQSQTEIGSQVTVTDAKDEPSKPYFVIPLRTGDAPLGGKKEFAVKIRYDNEINE